MLRSLDTTSVASRARAAILEAILDGRFEERLPTEEELGRMLQVSRTSIRAALQDLEIQGLISRRRALGTVINAHVRPTTLGLHRLIGFDRLLTERGHNPKVGITWKVEKIDPMFVRSFGLAPHLECLQTSRRFEVADSTAAIGIMDAIPIDNLKDRRVPKVVADTIFEFSKRFCTNTIDHATVSIVPMMSATPTPLADSIHSGQPFIRLLETHYSKEAQVVAWSIIDVNDDFVRFEVVRRD